MTAPATGWRGEALLALGKIASVADHAHTALDEDPPDLGRIGLALLKIRADAEGARRRIVDAPVTLPAPGYPDGLYQASLPYAVAGLVVRDGRVREAAPVIRWTSGHGIVEIAAWVARREGELVYCGAEASA